MKAHVLAQCDGRLHTGQIGHTRVRIVWYIMSHSAFKVQLENTVKELPDVSALLHI